MNYSEEANAKMISLIEEFDHEINYRIRSEEMKLEDDKDELKRAYIRQLEKIRGGVIYVNAKSYHRFLFNR